MPHQPSFLAINTFHIYAFLLHKMSKFLSKLPGFSRRTKDRKLAKASNKSHQDNDASLNASKSGPAISTIVAGSTSRSVDESYQPKNLWQDAFGKLDDDKKATLEASGDNSIIVEKVIKQTEEKYKEYKESGWKIKRGKGKSEINVRDEAKKILISALRFKDLIDAGVQFDPTGHGNSPSALRITFCVLKRQTASSAWTIISLGLQVDWLARPPLGIWS